MRRDFIVVCVGEGWGEVMIGGAVRGGWALVLNGRNDGGVLLGKVWVVVVAEPRDVVCRWGGFGRTRSVRTTLAGDAGVRGGVEVLGASAGRRLSG